MSAEEYDAEVIAMGHVFEDDPPEDDDEPVVELTFLAEPEAPAGTERQREVS